MKTWTNEIDYCENILIPEFEYWRVRGYNTNKVVIPYGLNQDTVSLWMAERYECRFLGGREYMVVFSGKATGKVDTGKPHRGFVW